MLLVIVPPGDRGMAALDWLTIVGFTAVLALLYVAIDTLSSVALHARAP
jgi:hypothetical protein